MINFSKFNSIISLTSYFTSDAKCMQAIIESRWGVGEQQDVDRSEHRTYESYEAYAKQLLV